MGVRHITHKIGKKTINCKGTSSAELCISAIPEIRDNPSDIVLIVDQSGSIQQDLLNEMKKDLIKVLDIIDISTDAKDDKILGNNNKIGLVTFSTDATISVPLTDSLNDLYAGVNRITTSGSTNHYAAFELAGNLVKTGTNANKRIVLFTDGVTTVGDPAVTITNQLKSEGIEIYCLGLPNQSGDVDKQLNEWASTPLDKFVFLAPTIADMEEVFINLTKNLVKVGTTNVKIEIEATKDFEIIPPYRTYLGTITQVNPQTITWEYPYLGRTNGEVAILNYNIKHISDNGGTLLVHQNITYQDAENHTVSIPVQSVTVENCVEPIVEIDDKPTPIDMTIDPCKDCKEVDLQEIKMSALGRILNLRATIKNICPNKKVALMITLNELDSAGTEYNRGMKAYTIPAHSESSCKDIEVKNICFVLPEDLSQGACKTMCCERKFRARAYVNYIDYDCPTL